MGGDDEKGSSLVYILHKDYAWHPATLEKTEKGKATVSVPEYADEQSIQCDGGRNAKKRSTQTVDLKYYLNKVLPLQNVDNNGNLIEFPDMVELPFLHEAAILYNLKLRHIKGKPYTRTGDIIIAINPFQWFTEIYTDKVRTLYSNKLVWTETGEMDPRKGVDPHVYETSSLCYKGLAFEHQDQSILVSGESGAGKTETVKIAMNHMASVQRGPVNTSVDGDKFEDPVVNRVLMSNPLLEAFGNAKTVRNDNSSRFGKYTQLQFDKSECVKGLPDRTKSTCKLAGSKCEAYLLEKNRVTGHEGAERTYHIFYQIIAAPDAKKTSFWSGMAGTNFDSFKYVGHTDTLKIEKRTDEQHFETTCETLELINLGGDTLVTLMRAIISVMQCGNLTFGTLGGDADKSECTSAGELGKLADLMGVATGDLNMAFTERTMKTRNETYKVPLNAETAKNSCDAFAKEVYGKLFLWLVQGINEATRAENNYEGGNGEFGIIGLLDIFGFESFVVNRFEQLCINYANEKLQQKFTEDIFRSVQDEYEAEGIELAEITYDDNTDVLDLIEGRTGLCALLNEECVRPKGSDEAFVAKALSANKKSPCMIVNNMDRMGFGIHHYAGKVMYSAQYFVERNQDTLPTDLEDVMAKSNNFIIAFKPAAPASKSGAPKRQKSNIVGSTIWSKYKTQLAALMGDLRKTRSRYIRCLKPNKAKVPVKMDHLGTVEQLRCAGVVAAVTITRSAFPNRLENDSAKFRYATMWDRKKYPSKKTDADTPAEALKKDCEALMLCALKEREEDGKKAFVVGNTRTYFRAGALEYLEANRAAGMDGQARTIQALGRGYLARKKFGNLRGQKEAEERKKREEEERKKRAAEDAKRKAEEAKRAEEARKAAAAKAEKERKEREEKERLERLEREKQEKLEREAREKEEKEKQKQVKKLKKEIDKLKEELAEKEAVNNKKIKKAETIAEEAEKEAEGFKQKYEAQQAEAGKVDKSELEAMQKKMHDSEKLVKFLKKDNEKTREHTRDMEADIEDMKETNHKLVEASASAGASLDSLEKQRARIAEHNAKLEDNLKKYKDQNKQLENDLANRQAYFDAESKIKQDYEKAMEKIVDLMEDKCDDSDLVEKIMTAQLTCTTNNLNRLGGDFM